MMEQLIRKMADVVPDQYRQFTVDPMTARTRYGAKPSMLREWIDTGLPHRMVDGEPRFDRHDLINLSLDLAVPSVWTLSMRYWSRALSFPGPMRHARIFYTFTCPQPGHPGPCEVEVLTPDQGYWRREFTGSPATTPLDVVSEFRMNNVWPAIPPEVHEVASVLRDVEFKMLPWGMPRGDDWVREVGWSECVGAARLLVAEADRRGIPARFSLGFATVLPYSVMHCWAEFLIEDVWVPMDPLMIYSMIRWGLLDAREFDPTPPAGVVLGRLSGEVTAPGRHNGEFTLLSTSTVLVNGDR